MMDHLERYDLAWLTGEPCHKNKFYLYFLLPCLCIFVLGILIINAYRLVLFTLGIIRKKKKKRSEIYGQDQVASVLGLSSVSSVRSSLTRTEHRPEQPKGNRFQRLVRRVEKGCEKAASGQSLVGKILVSLLHFCTSYAAHASLCFLSQLGLLQNTCSHPLTII